MFKQNVLYLSRYSSAPSSLHCQNPLHKLLEFATTCSFIMQIHHPWLKRRYRYTFNLFVQWVRDIQRKEPIGIRLPVAWSLADFSWLAGEFFKKSRTWPTGVFRYSDFWWFVCEFSHFYGQGAFAVHKCFLGWSVWMNIALLDSWQDIL